MGEMLRAILESASQAILSVGQDGRIRSANLKAGEMFGYEAGQMVGLEVEELIPPTARETHRAHRGSYFEAPWARPMGLGMELMARHRDGTEFPVEISLSHVEEETGARLAIAFISDITGRKRLEAQLMRSQKLEAVGRLAGGVAHDFNNLLMVISGYNRMLLDRLTPQDPLRGYAEQIDRAAERAGALTKQLLAFSRKQMIQPRVLNLNQLLAEASQMLRQVLGESIELVVQDQPGLGNVRTDPGQMEQVLLNLVLNARDAIAGLGRITIETANVNLDEDYARTHLGVTAGRYVMLAVTDTGRGMDAETRSHIFEPFFTTKPAGAGTGLGLSTVYGIVKQNRGDVWVYSEPGAGTTFKVYLPRVDAAEPAAVAGTHAGASGGTETVLVVEDESGVRELIQHLLAQHGYNVLTAGDVLEGLQVSAAHAGPIHLLLTDVMLPRGTGWELAERLAPARPDMKVLYISGYAEHAIARRGVIGQEVAFLPKPFSFETLMTKVRAILGDGDPGMPGNREEW